MRRTILFISLLFVSTLLSACGVLYRAPLTPEPGPPDPPLATALPTNPAQSLPKLSGEWLVQLTQSGGIAGVSRSLEISNSGEMTMRDARSGEKKVSQLAPKKLEELGKLVASSSYQPASQPSGCADCFIFNLQITSADGTFQSEMDQIALQDSGLRPLVDFLAVMLNTP